MQRICCKGWRHWNADQTIVIWLWSKKNFEPLFNDEVARGVGILFNRGTVEYMRFWTILVFEFWGKNEHVKTVTYSKYAWI